MCGNYSREETIEGRKLYEVIWYITIVIWERRKIMGRKTYISLDKEKRKSQLLTDTKYISGIRDLSVIILLEGGNVVQANLDLSK